MRRGPEDLPASNALQWLTILAYCGAMALASAIAGVPQEQWLGPLAIDVVLTLIWLRILLQIVQRPERMLQTTSAVFGLQVLLTPLAVPLARLAATQTQGELPPPHVLLLLFAVSIWSLVATARILRSALDWRMGACIALVIVQALVVHLLVALLFIEAPKA